MEEIVAVGSAAPAPAPAPADRSRYGGRRCVEFSKHAATTIYLYHLFRTLSTPRPSTQPSSLPRLTTPYIDIPQHENTLAPIPDRHTSSASDWLSWIQPSAGSLSLYSVPPPPLHRVHYIAQQSGPCLRPPSPVPLISLPSHPAPCRLTRTLGSIRLHISFAAR